MSKEEAAAQLAWLTVWSIAQHWGEEEELGHRNHCGWAGFACDVTGINDAWNCAEKPSWGACLGAAVTIGSYAIGAGPLGAAAREGRLGIRSLRDSRAATWLRPPYGYPGFTAEEGWNTVVIGENLVEKVVGLSERLSRYLDITSARRGSTKS